jgi:hypothetical protein
MSEWQPIKTAPKDRPFLGGYYKKGAWVTEVIQALRFGEWEGFATVQGKYPRYELTHWQPMPDPPK